MGWPAASGEWVVTYSQSKGTNMMFWYGHDMGWWGYAGMAILMAVFWALPIGGIAALVKYFIDDRPVGPDTPSESASPADVLAGRFARGEISEKEYRDRLAVLHEYGLR
jgi:putative membrane protein